HDLFSRARPAVASAQRHGRHAHMLVSPTGSTTYLRLSRRTCGASGRIRIVSAETSIAPSRPRRSPNRRRAVARMAVWAILLSGTAVLVPYLLVPRLLA